MVHTYLMLGENQAALEESKEDFGFGTAVALAKLGRTQEAVDILIRNEPPPSFRIGRLYMMAFRSMLEGRREDMVQASDELEIANSQADGTMFRDPEGWYYQTLQLGYLGEVERGLRRLSRTVEMGFFCYPAFLREL